jgi:hypothetical protein
MAACHRLPFAWHILASWGKWSVRKTAFRCEAEDDLNPESHGLCHVPINGDMQGTGTGVCCCQLNAVCKVQPENLTCVVREAGVVSGLFSFPDFIRRQIRFQFFPGGEGKTTLL